MGKYCVYRSCKSHQLSKHSRADGVLFFPVPKPKKNYEKCLRWVNAINRDDITVTTIKAHHNVCSNHFINGKGPTPEYPDPVKDIKQSPITLDHNYAYCFTDTDIGNDDRIDSQSNELINKQLVAISEPQAYLPVILKVETPESNLVETLEPTLSSAVNSEDYVNNVVTSFKTHDRIDPQSSELIKDQLVAISEPQEYLPVILKVETPESNLVETLEPTLSAAVDSEDYVNNVVTSFKTHDRIDAQSSELITDELVVTSAPQEYLPVILKVETPESNLVETLEPTLIATVDSEDYVNNVVTSFKTHERIDAQSSEPIKDELVVTSAPQEYLPVILKVETMETPESNLAETLEPTSIATVDSEDYVNNILTSQIDIHPLRKVAHEFLDYQANNFDKCEWSIDVVQESLNYLTIPKLLTFRKITSNSLVILEILPTMKSTIKFCNKPISRDHILFSTSSVDFDKEISCLEDLMFILHEIENWRTCYGVQGEQFSHFRDKYLKSAHFCLESQSIRSEKCHQLVMGVTARICPACRSTRKILVSRMKRKSQNNTLDVKSTTNIRYMSPDQVKRKLAILRKKNVALKRRVKLLEQWNPN